MDVRRAQPGKKNDAESFSAKRRVGAVATAAAAAAAAAETEKQQKQQRQRRQPPRKKTNSSTMRGGTRRDYEGSWLRAPIPTTGTGCARLLAAPVYAPVAPIYQQQLHGIVFNPLIKGRCAPDRNGKRVPSRQYSTRIKESENSLSVAARVPEAISRASRHSGIAQLPRLTLHALHATSHKNQVNSLYIRL